MNFYDKKVRRLVSIIILVVIIAISGLRRV